MTDAKREAGLAELSPRQREQIAMIQRARAADVDQVSAAIRACFTSEVRGGSASLSPDEFADRAVATCFPRFEWFVRGSAMSVAGLATDPSSEELDSYAEYEVGKQRAEARKQVAAQVAILRGQVEKK
jgi:hypothetical protein